MKRKLVFLPIYIILLIAPCLLNSCEIESSDNGKLDGFWQLATVDTLATGGSADLTATGLTWSFQGRLLQLREVTMKSKFDNILCRFSHNGNKLTVNNPAHVDREKGDPIVENVDDLRPFGINNLEETFTVVTLSNKIMVLKSDHLQLNFRKY